jgi:hypothetical protein
VTLCAELMGLSTLEQDLACYDNSLDHFRDLTAKLTSGSCRPDDALRLVMLYALRYQNNRSARVRGVLQC